MQSILDKISFQQYRFKTFKGSSFEKQRVKCNSKKMSEAGFYFCPTENETDLVKCYACGIEIHGWNKNSDDPWTLHEKESPDCLYLEIKKSYSNEITVKEFLEIEKYRYLKLNDTLFKTKTKAIERISEEMLANI